MARIMNLSILMWLWLLLAATSARRRPTKYPSYVENEYQTMENLTNSLTNIVKISKFLSADVAELQVVVATIDSSMVDYQGLARNHLDSLHKKYNSTLVKYQQVVDPVFEWCVSIEGTLHAFINDIDDPAVKQSDLNIIWNNTANAVLIEGIKTANKSLKNMNNLKSKVNSLRLTLDGMLESVQRDFGGNGFYFREQPPSEAHCPKKPCVRTISRFFSHILELAKSYPNDFSDRLFQKLNSLGINEVIDKHRLPSYKDQLNTVISFFEVLSDKMQRADVINGQVVKDLEQEHHYLKSPTQVTFQNIMLISRNHDHIHHLAPKFRALRKACDDYKSLRDGKSSSADDPKNYKYKYGTINIPPYSTETQPSNLPNDSKDIPVNNYGIQTKASNFTESQFENITKELLLISKDSQAIIFLPVPRDLPINNEFHTIKDLINSLTKVVSRFTSTFEPNSNMRELQVVISTIDRTMVDYQGSAKIHLIPLRNASKSALLIYQQVVDPVFKWCVSIEGTLHDFINDIDNPALKQSDRNIIWNITADTVLIEGIKTAMNSLEKLNLLKSEVSILGRTLDGMLESVKTDFGGNAFMVGTISRFFNHILEFYKSYPNDFLEPLFQKLNSLGLGGVINKSRRPSYKDQLDTVRSFFEVLNNKIQYAAVTNGQVIADLEQDQHSLQIFPQLGTENIASLLSISSHLRTQLVPHFQNLRKACDEYKSWRAPKDIQIDYTSPEQQTRHLPSADPMSRPNIQTVQTGLTTGTTINNEHQTVENVTNSLTKVVRRFTTEFESESNLKKLQGILATIDSPMVYFQKATKIYLDSLRTDYKSARLTYQQVVDPVFEWCVSIDGTLQNFINDIADPELKQSDIAIIWSITGNAVLIEGIKTAISSSEKLHHLKSIIRNLDMTLDRLVNEPQILSFQGKLHKIKSAAETNSLVSEELEQDQHYLDSVLQQRTKNVEWLLSRSPGLALHLVPKLQDLRKACDDFITSWENQKYSKKAI